MLPRSDVFMIPEKIKSLPKYKIIQLLHEETLSFEEVMRAFDIYVSLCDLGPKVLGMVYYSTFKRYYIVINCYIESFKVRQEVFFHELCHIIEDMPTRSYVVDLDNERHEIEERADKFFECVTKAYNYKNY